MKTNLFDNSKLEKISLNKTLPKEKGWVCLHPQTKQDDVEPIFNKISETTKSAHGREGVIELIMLYKSVLDSDQLNYEALWNLGRYYFLLAYGYTESHQSAKKKKMALFCEQIKYCEQAMYTNADFRNLVDAGHDIVSASRALSKNEIGALCYWYYAHGAIWRQCLSPMGRLMNIPIILNAKKIVQVMYDLDPTWLGGRPTNNWAVYYSAIPKILGGDIKKAESYYLKSIKLGQNKVYMYHDRALYLHTKTKNKKAFIEDMTRIANSDPEKVDDPFPLNVFLKNSARHALLNVNDYIPE